jgi:hypothetical protein
LACQTHSPDVIPYPFTSLKGAVFAHTELGRYKNKSEIFNYFSVSLFHYKVCRSAEEFFAVCQNPGPPPSLGIILHLVFSRVLTFLWDEQDLKLFSLLIVAVF